MGQQFNQIKIREVPLVEHAGLRDFLSDLKLVVEGLQTNAAPPPPPTNFKVTPVAGGNVVAFTRSAATNFRIYYGSSPQRGQAQFIDIGSNNQWTDTVGQGGITRYYWVEAINSTSVSQLVGPLSGTTLALTVPATVTPPPAQSFQQVFDTTLNRNRPVVYPIDRIASPRQTPGGG